MIYRLSNIKVRENLTEEQVILYALKKYSIKEEEVDLSYIYKRSIDARDKNDIFFNYSIDVKLKKDRNIKNAKVVEENASSLEVLVKRKSHFSPVIVGAGPAGLFCALVLVKNGIKPIIIEQGSKVEKRIEDVDNFKNSGELNTRSNVQFGEGGAGTFSDGKLTTGNETSLSREVLKEFVSFGAPKEILYNAKPHIGTDNLVKIVRNIRQYIESCGGKYLFDTKVTDLKVENGKICGVYCNDKLIETDTVILAIGHSARDTFSKLLEKNVEIKPKNFAVGIRIEHLQENINIAQFGQNSSLNLPPAEYKLIHHTSSGRVCYTFCMCPGGQVVASSSEEGTIVTNGMSKFMRNGKNANSALIVNITPDDCKGDSPLRGMYFQEELEKKAYIMGGKNYFAPAQKVGDYLENVKSENFGDVSPTYMPGVALANLNDLFPEYINEALKEAIVAFDKKLKGFGSLDALLTAPETRTSSPVQITRDKESMMSNIIGLYPCGEGAGYAGGIMTSAVDGIKVGVKILESE